MLFVHDFLATVPFDVYGLHLFHLVAKHGSFTAAANALLISQSALSRHVIALEKLLGQQLFERRVEESVDVAWGKTPHAEVHVKQRLM